MERGAGSGPPHKMRHIAGNHNHPVARQPDKRSGMVPGPKKGRTTVVVRRNVHAGMQATPRRAQLLQSHPLMTRFIAKSFTRDPPTLWILRYLYATFLPKLAAQALLSETETETRTVAAAVLTRGEINTVPGRREKGETSNPHARCLHGRKLNFLLQALRCLEEEKEKNFISDEQKKKKNLRPTLPDGRPARSCSSSWPCAAPSPCCPSR